MLPFCSECPEQLPAQLPTTLPATICMAQMCSTDREQQGHADPRGTHLTGAGARTPYPTTLRFLSLFGAGSSQPPNLQGITTPYLSQEPGERLLAPS